MKNLLCALTFLSAFHAFAQSADSAVFYYQKGMEEKNAKRFLVASKQFEKAISFNAKYTDAYIANGYANLEMRRTDPAIINFTKAYELDSTNNATITELMNLYFSYRQYAKAIAMAQKCKECTGAGKVVALSYFQTEDYAKAEKALLAELAKNPTDAELNYSLGRAYLEMEAEKNAIVYYNKAVQLDSTKSAWLHELGLLYYTVNDYKNAAVYFNKAAAQGFNQSNDFNENLGFSYLYSGETNKGEKILQEVLAKKPNNKDLLRDMADAFYQMKQYDKSLDYLQKLMEMDPKDGQALYQAGQCFIKKGQKDRGQAMCDKAIELDPSLNKLKKQKAGSGFGL
ncbi:MAG: tetratricopeptide repeat protein [Bacteroidetes bacterium]|nr:tetratricopeptide repeat protein [Bacteroidota bacterium]